MHHSQTSSITAVTYTTATSASVGVGLMQSFPESAGTLRHAQHSGTSENVVYTVEKCTVVMGSSLVVILFIS